MLETDEKKRTELDLDAKVDALSKFFDIMATSSSRWQANFPRSLSRKGPDTVRSLLAGRQAQKPSPIISNLQFYN